MKQLTPTNLFAVEVQEGVDKLRFKIMPDNTTEFVGNCYDGEVVGTCYFSKVPTNFKGKILGTFHNGKADFDVISPMLFGYPKHKVKQKLNQQPQYDMFWIEKTVVPTKYFDTSGEASLWAYTDHILSLLQSNGLNPESKFVILEKL